MQQGNRVFPVVFPVGGASLVASPLRSDYPSYAPGLSVLCDRPDDPFVWKC